MEFHHCKPFRNFHRLPSEILWVRSENSFECLQRYFTEFCLNPILIVIKILSGRIKHFKFQLKLLMDIPTEDPRRFCLNSYCDLIVSFFNSLRLLQERCDRIFFWTRSSKTLKLFLTETRSLSPSEIMSEALVRNFI